ncbi:hypothetical protein GCM10008915_36540 [Bifidobacterium pullorum subsp. gallinarum]
MAKLSVVVPSNEVEVGGVKYRKVERAAQMGDIVKITDEDMPEYVIKGAFYGVKRIDSCGDPHIVDEDGDDFDLCGDDFEVYEKVTEPAAPEYREVKRKAEKGERIRIVKRDVSEDDYENGDEFIVNEVDSDGDVRVNIPQRNRKLVLLSEYVVLEPVNVAEPTPQPKRPTVGDYVRVIANTCGHRYVIGSVVKIVEDDRDGTPYQAERADGTTGNWLKESEVVPATEAEFNAQKRFKVGEFAKVVGPNDNGNNYEIGSVVEITKCDPDSYSNVVYKAKKPDGSIGNYVREYQLVRTTKAEFEAQGPQPDRLKVGEYVKVTDASGAGAAKEGDIAVVTNDNWGGSIGEIIDVKTLDGRTYGMFACRFVRATESEVEAAKKAVKIGEFADGGYAVIANPSGSNASYNAIESAGAYVKVSVTDGYRKLALHNDKGELVGYCYADALRKVTREEYEEATKPKPVFSVGDKVRITRNQANWPEGTVVTIIDPNVYGTGETARAKSDNGDVYLTDYAAFEKLSAEEIARIEGEATKPRLSVGDLARTLVGKDVPKGAIVKIMRDDRSGMPFRGELLDGSEYDWYTSEQLEKVSEEESKWAEIGRKVNEFKRGDIVQVTQYVGLLSTGTVGEVGEIDGGQFRVNTPERTAVNWHSAHSAKLIVPVEQRFDKAEGGASPSK